MPKLITRTQWRARGGDGASLSGPLDEVIIHTEDGPNRPDLWLTEQFASAVRGIEAFHMGPQRRWDGIAYSWLIADNGDCFEGRGWLQSGAHTEGHNRTAHAICFLGNGDADDATPAQWASARWLIGQGIGLGAVRRDPKISGHRDYSTKSCPGDRIYPHLGRLRGITGHVPDHEEEDPMAGITIAEIEAAVGRAQETFWGGKPIASGQRTPAGTVAATLSAVQTLTNELRSATGQLGARIAQTEEALEAAFLAGIATMPTADIDQADIDQLVGQLLAHARELGLGTRPEAIADVLAARLAA